MTPQPDAYWDMVSELPPELKNDEDYRLMCEQEAEAEYIEMLDLVIECQRCNKQGDLGCNCLLCPDRPFGKTPCRPDFHCWDEDGGVCGEGGYCNLILICDYITEHECPLADIAEEMFGGLMSAQEPQKEYIITEDQLSRFGSIGILQDVADIRSRPYSSGTDAKVIASCLECRYYPEYLDEQILARYPLYKKEIERKAASTERERVLVDIENYVKDGLKSRDKLESWDSGYATCCGDILNCIKNIRERIHAQQENQS